jgi:hypothetical protein
MSRMISPVEPGTDLYDITFAVDNKPTMTIARLRQHARQLSNLTNIASLKL